MNDEKIGANVARLRGEKSQKEVADAMKALGFKWSQSTVSDVEAGRRPLKLTEGYALAAVLDLGAAGMDTFLRSDAAANFRNAARTFLRKDQELRAAMNEWWDKQFYLAIYADELAKSGDMDGHDLLIADSWVATTMEAVMKEAWAHHRAEGIEDHFAADYEDDLPEGTTYSKVVADSEAYHARVAADPARRFESKLHEMRHGKPQTSA